MMFSASYAWGLSEYNDGYYYLVSQLKSAGLGLLLMFATSYLDYHFFQNTKIAYIAFIATYLLTFYTALFGIDVAGAKRWIQIGPISFQPSELLKVTFIIIFAYIMSVNYPKFKDWKFCIIPFTVIMGAVALVLAEGFPRQLIAIFGAANESSYYTDFAIKAFRTYLCMMVLACVNKACFIFLQAVGKALSSTLLSMFREVVFGVGFALLLPVFFGLDGVLYSMPVSDILTFIISAVIIVKTYRELHTEGVQKV